MSARAQFLKNCQDICTASPHVSVDYKQISTLAVDFGKAAQAPSWSNYISAEANQTPLDMTRVLFEMAMICAQQGGFITPDDKGHPQKWNIGGSGASAMLAKMAEIRDARCLPYIDIEDTGKLEGMLLPLLAGVPFAQDRIAMFKEFADPNAYAALDSLVKGAKQGDGYNFDFDFIEKLAQIFPQSFATDPFRKKAILSVLMTAAHAQTKGVTVKTDAPIASDYVLPQVLEAMGVLKVSEDLAHKLKTRQGFDENDATVRDLRAATITACEAMCQISGAKAQDVDATLWLMGRDKDLKPKMKPAMNVYTTWF